MKLFFSKHILHIYVSDLVVPHIKTWQRYNKKIAPTINPHVPISSFLIFNWGDYIIRIDIEKEILDGLIDASLIKIESHSEINKTVYEFIFRDNKGDLIKLNGSGPPENSVSWKCLNCGESLEINYEGGCPKCGDKRKEISMEIHLPPLKGTISAGYESNKNSIDIKWLYLTLLIVITFLANYSSTLIGSYGLWISILFGLFISAYTGYLGYYAITKVRETKKWSQSRA
ncbi:hypothetical protein [Methanobacterium sp.]|uniref:hypothetical protein n=1 Tax=Methanobacterium sp. TaxID=2164 RepID=UPI002AB9FC3C|nr:hypothetical protein [Methanobacterium sp.]MDY9922768.1 hypothetical protein [Methanobacterium sp.]